MIIFNLSPFKIFFLFVCKVTLLKFKRHHQNLKTTLGFQVGGKERSLGSNDRQVGQIAWRVWWVDCETTYCGFNSCEISVSFFLFFFSFWKSNSQNTKMTIPLLRQRLHFWTTSCALAFIFRLLDFYRIEKCYFLWWDLNPQPVGFQSIQKLPELFTPDTLGRQEKILNSFPGPIFPTCQCKRLTNISLQCCGCCFVFVDKIRRLYPQGKCYTTESSCVPGCTRFSSHPKKAWACGFLWKEPTCFFFFDYAKSLRDASQSDVALYK